jgi:hypothetical protein
VSIVGVVASARRAREDPVRDRLGDNIIEQAHTPSVSRHSNSASASRGAGAPRSTPGAGLDAPIVKCGDLDSSER